MNEPQVARTKTIINSPNGNSASVFYIGQVKLAYGLMLNRALYVFAFKLKLLLISNLAHNNNCFITFYPTFYLIQGYDTGAFKGIGRQRKGL